MNAKDLAWRRSRSEILFYCLKFQQTGRSCHNHTDFGPIFNWSPKGQNLFSAEQSPNCPISMNIILSRHEIYPGGKFHCEDCIEAFALKSQYKCHKNSGLLYFLCEKCLATFTRCIHTGFRLNVMYVTKCQLEKWDAIITLHLYR